MSTTHNLDENLKTAKSYYKAMLDKDIVTLAKYLHDDVQIISPLAEIEGKINVLEAAENLMALLKNINFRAECAFGTQVMMAYDFIFPEPINNLRASVLFDFDDKKITSIELFYDGRPFDTLKEKIFNSQ